MTSAVLLRAVSPIASLLCLVGCESMTQYEPPPSPPTETVGRADARPAVARPVSPMSAAAAAAAPQPAPASRPAAVVAPQQVPADVVATDHPATQPVDAAGAPAAKLPYTVERFERPGPVRGVVARIDVGDPRVNVKVLLADPRDPDGPEGKAVGRLDTVSDAARANGLAVAVNASFFAIGGQRTAEGKRVGYFVGNATWPVGFHLEDGRLVSSPAEPDKLRATMIVHADRHVTLDANVRQLPEDARYAVSGSAKVLSDGMATVSGPDLFRHPRTAVGITADGHTLLLVAVDGRRQGWSNGATLGELATLMKSLGATDAINLDGGGSTTLVARDAVTGVYAVANRPSEQSAVTPGLDSVERPVADVIGIEVREP